MDNNCKTERRNTDYDFKILLAEILFIKYEIVLIIYINVIFPLGTFRTTKYS